MESNWAAENLQTIRTLMERSAVYRRALAPVMTYAGVIGMAAAGVGIRLKINNAGWFAIYWMVISLVAIAGAFMLVRRQALKSGEPFWSPPTRRVTQAMFPSLLVGLVFGLFAASSFLGDQYAPPAAYLTPIWALLYGLALNAAGFFMPRGIKLFGWAFIIVGIALLIGLDPIVQSGSSPHLLMGILFGASHLAYGIYLYFTESRKNEA